MRLMDFQHPLNASQSRWEPETARAGSEPGHWVHSAIGRPRSHPIGFALIWITCDVRAPLTASSSLCGAWLFRHSVEGTRTANNQLGLGSGLPPTIGSDVGSSRPWPGTTPLQNRTGISTSS